MEAFVVASVLALAFANGANDNMKGVATLCGSGALSYWQSLAVATLATLLGSLASVVLARGLVAAFSAKGLLPAAVVTRSFIGAVAAAATVTMWIATRVGLPVSTTHVATGGIFGIGVSRNRLQRGMTGSVVGAWIGTLPPAAALGAAAYVAMARL